MPESQILRGSGYLRVIIIQNHYLLDNQLKYLYLFLLQLQLKYLYLFLFQLRLQFICQCLLQIFISSTNPNEEKTETPPTEFAPVVDPLPNRRVSSRSNKNQTTWYDAFSLNRLQSLDWSGFLSDIDSSEFRSFVANEFDPYEGIYEGLDPMLLSVATKNRDNSTYHQAMNGPDCEGLRKQWMLSIILFKKL